MLVWTGTIVAYFLAEIRAGYPAYCAFTIVTFHFQWHFEISLWTNSPKWSKICCFVVHGKSSIQTWTKLRVLSSRIWRHAVRQMTDVSKEYIASNLRVENTLRKQCAGLLWLIVAYLEYFQPWRQRQYGPTKHRRTSIGLHDFTWQAMYLNEEP